MKTVCAWCNYVIKEGNGEISHGCCGICKLKLDAELFQYKVEKKKALVLTK